MDKGHCSEAGIYWCAGTAGLESLLDRVEEDPQHRPSERGLNSYLGRVSLRTGSAPSGGIEVLPAGRVPTTHVFSCDRSRLAAWRTSISSRACALANWLARICSAKNASEQAPAFQSHPSLSISPFSSPLSSWGVSGSLSSLPSKAFTSAFRKTLNTVSSTAAFGSSKLPENGTRVPKRSLG